ncbi:CoA-dependent acyltransferase [Hyphopichia burtonii NRRL Y-1933]|uniref:CoA-dependent acyltransferase n=1 Tax=Hyphopichia burtonii NRRL Y-1933 TaxID=984485 RepID=A0A1E4RHM3_9ASCO|nr:CoA-dependent acyltransferase [Hyphopichia burtonii NRRL Y-1933]ODV66750.1 CoA-dependent acyltransferase [Hyphopichia burtonii NRRL Y-1933]
MSSTYKYEQDLPCLPVPSLEATTQRLLCALQPLITPDEYLDLVQEMNEFANDDTILLIQKHLEAVYESNPELTCYLSSINDETNPGIYGELRGDILPRNPYLILEEDPYSKTINPPNQAQRAASLINSSLKFIVSLRNETLKPDLTPKNNTPLTMNCYRNLFGTTRVPGESKSQINSISIKKSPLYNESRHIIVICNNQFYQLEVLTRIEDQTNNSNHNIWFNDFELSVILNSIIEESDKVDNIDSINNSIGSITTQSYSQWKIGRLELQKASKGNLEIIDNALFVVILDNKNSPTDDQLKTSVISHGTSTLKQGTNIQIGSCTSRWYDKLQIIVTSNSVAGVVWESTSMDSTAILRFLSDIYTDLILKLARNINGSEYTLFDNNVEFVLSKIDKPNKIQLLFKKTPELQNLIHLSETRLADIISQHEYKTLNLKLDTHIVNNIGISIDSFLQICFQISNYTLYGKMANTLEPITTRKFKDSRTELIPIQNEKIFNLCKQYITRSNRESLWDMFLECCRDHGQQYHDAMLGKGFERHFTSILHILNNHEIVDYLNKINNNLTPLNLKNINEISLLLNPFVDRITKPELLISNCGNPALHLFGIPPAIDQGFGIGYIIHKDKVQITILSKHRQTDRFLDTFTRITNDIRNIFKSKLNIFVNLSTDSSARKNELQKLRRESEWKNINKDLPSTKHPIDLTIDKTTIPLESINMSRTRSLSSSLNSDDYDVLGGYGYFDFGELDLRADNSSVQSFTKSKGHSELSSRTSSSSDLMKIQNIPQNDVKQKLSLSERIRDRLSHSQDTLSQLSLNDPDESSEVFQRPKHQVGRQVKVSKF